ncbi:hypothetical protein U1Q18_036091 [Sarracenia purpurea var. burkii]
MSRPLLLKQLAKANDNASVTILSRNPTKANDNGVNVKTKTDGKANCVNDIFKLSQLNVGLLTTKSHSITVVVVPAIEEYKQLEAQNKIMQSTYSMLSIVQ